MSEQMKYVKWKAFQSEITSWNALLGEAAAFAAQVGRERLINISHSEGNAVGVVVVWYWSPNPPEGAK